jgi:hypothetical protein
VKRYAVLAYDISSGKNALVEKYMFLDIIYYFSEPYTMAVGIVCTWYMLLLFQMPHKNLMVLAAQ